MPGESAQHRCAEDMASPLADFAIGNLARGHVAAEQWVGMIDEVRISDVARAGGVFV